MEPPVDQTEPEQPAGTRPARDEPLPAPDRVDVLDHLARILESREFRAARNRARFLEYVITRTLDGAEDGLKEYTIGVEVFDRGASFDPRTDGVVRTQAGLVRKHLERFYATEGRGERIEIILPKGHYVPQIQRRAAPAATGDSASGNTASGRGNGAFGDGAFGDGASGDSASGNAASGTTASVGPTWPWPPAGRRTLPPGLAAGAAALVVLSVMTAWIVRSRATPPADDAGPDARGDARRPAIARDAGLSSPVWTQFVAPGASTVLAFGIPQFFSGPDGIWVRDVEVNSSAAPLPPGGRLAAIRRQLKSLQPAEAYTGIGEAYGVYLLSRFFLGHAHDLRVVRSPTLTWDTLKHDNVIFLTSARFKTLADQLSYPSEFTHVVGTPNRVINLHPAAGEQAEYVTRGGPLSIDHAIISVWPGKRPGRRVLVLSGGHTWGTQAAAEYVTEPDYLRELDGHLLACQRRQGLARHPEFFQVLLRVEIRDNQPVGARYLTHHDLAIGATGDPITAPPATLAAQER